MADTIIVQPIVPTVVVSTNGPQGAIGPAGPQGPPGVSGGNFAFTQATAQSTWTIAHNLGFKPSVTTTDTAGNVVEGTVLYLTTNTLEVTFGIAIAGFAYLS